MKNVFFVFTQPSYLNEEINTTKPFPFSKNSLHGTQGNQGKMSLFLSLVFSPKIANVNTA